MKNKSLLLLLNFFFLFFTSYSQQAKEEVKWPIGVWQTQGEGGQTMYEEWNKIADSLYKGESYTMTGNRRQVYENVLLKYVDGKLCYAPTVTDQNGGKEVVFPLKEISEGGKKFVFENLKHDYPQRIIYHFKNETTLDARIEGIVGGKEKFSDFHFTKK